MTLRFPRPRGLLLLLSVLATGGPASASAPGDARATLDAHAGSSTSSAESGESTVNPHADSHARGMEGDAPRMDGPDTDALLSRVHVLERQGLLPRGPGWWDASRVADVEAGLAALPPAMRRFPGGALELVLHDESAPLGLGDGTPERPDWSEGRARFHLYRHQPSTDRRAMVRLSRLTDAEVERLWRRRAVVHAVVQRWDDALGWSRDARWRRLAGWLAPFERPLVWKEQARIHYAGAFSRALGQRSASLDLVTFAEELLVPVESLREDALGIDDRVRCQEFSKARAFAELVESSGLGALSWRAPCPAFDAWAELDLLSHFEVLLVAATGRQPESLFGHLLLRPVWREGPRVRGPTFERVVQLVALTGMEARGLGYVVKGMTGGYDTVFLTGTMGDLAHEALELEQRTIRRFHLRLTRGEEARMLERVWELERRGYLGYYFFTDNCATALLFLLNGVMEHGREVRAPGTLWVLPTATLDALARVEVLGKDGRAGPLLALVPDAFESTGDRAVRANAAREAALSSLEGKVEARWLARLRDLEGRLQSPEPEARREAYQELPALVRAVLGSAEEGARRSARELLHAYVAHAVRMERAAVDRAEGVRLRIERARLLTVKTALEGSAAAGIRERQRVFEREDVLQRKLAVLDRTTLFQQALATAPRRLPTPEELKALVRADRTEAAFAAATDAQGELNDGVLAEVDPTAFLAEDRRRKVEAESAWAASAMRDSGAARTVVSVGMDFPDVGGPRPVVSVRTAGMAEALGDARLHGFQSSSELRVLDGELSVEPRWGLPRLVSTDMTLVGYRTLQRDLPRFRESAWDSLGWGAEARVASDASRSLPYRATVQAEALVVVDEAERFSRFTALGIGGLAHVHWSDAMLTPAAGPRLSLAHRTGLPGFGASAVRVEAAYAPTWRVGDSHLTHEAAASLQMEWWLGRAGPFGVLLTPRAQVRWEGTLSPPVRHASRSASSSWWSGTTDRRLALGVEVR
ncbi:DUF4105 domain-containing protein [Myxococcus stipitatus]|uniref:Lnb N-terminal periplasmic domain-containing protein n=1 Tax=Myxococcus stipitatus TaxID=83455 RepID=UPI001F431F2C|nr:DUF4105 domain-containing protein [Myxococcus stipitatus]MCE9670938.1 DUF4105 domain-containing protein [Myxococcus stipitatus]